MFAVALFPLSTHFDSRKALRRIGLERDEAGSFFTRRCLPIAMIPFFSRLVFERIAPGGVPLFFAPVPLCKTSRAPKS